MSRVLLVEDDPTIAEAFGLALEHAGYQVRTAEDASSAAKLIEQFDPEVVVLDLLLPDMSGLEMLELTHFSQKHPEAQVVVCTNMTNDTTRQKALNYGVAKYLTKSEYTPGQIVNLVAGLLQPDNQPQK